MDTNKLREEAKRLAFKYAERFHDFQNFATAEREHDLKVFRTALDDAIDRLAAQATQAVSEPVATLPAEAVAEWVQCERCGHENWIMEGKAPCQITAADKAAALAARPVADGEAANLRTVLESISEICNETRAARDLQPAMTEIRGMARAALARQAPAPLSQAVPEGLTDEEITTACEAWNHEVLEGRGGSHACNQFRKMLRWLRPQAVTKEPLLSDMDRGVLRMHFDLVWGDAISRAQFYNRVQSLLDRIEARPATVMEHARG